MFSISDNPNAELLSANERYDMAMEEQEMVNLPEFPFIDFEQELEERIARQHELPEETQPEGQPQPEKTEYISKKDNIVWSNTPVCDARGREPARNIISTEAKAVTTVDNYADAFFQFFDNYVWRSTVEHTNQYIQILNVKRPEPARLTDVDELKALVGLLLICAQDKSEHCDVDYLWYDDEMCRPILKLVMSAHRFRFLLRVLRFDNRTTREYRKKLDCFYPIRDLAEHVNKNFAERFVPTEAVVIDEMLWKYRGKVHFRQYIPSKPGRYGIKTFAICDSKTNYTFQIEPYLGANTGPMAQSNKAFDLVCRLAKPFFGTRRNITMDNFFTSIPLAEFLLSQNLTILGTLRKNKKEIPPEFVVLDKSQTIQHKVGYRDKMTLLQYSNKKEKMVLMLSTAHKRMKIDINGKPNLINEYNSSKFGVDVVDQMCANYNTARVATRWPMCVFFNLVNISAINALVIATFSKLEIKSRRNFIKKLGLQLVENHMRNRLSSGHLSRQLTESIQKHLGEDGRSSLTENVHQISNKRQRCGHCVRSDDVKTRFTCLSCKSFVCYTSEPSCHGRMICVRCLDTCLANLSPTLFNDSF